MKKNFSLALGVMLGMSVLAQPADPPLAAPAPAAAKAEAKKSTDKPAAKKSAEKTIVLRPGPAVVTGDNVNVRGRASFIGEIISRLDKGAKVTVIEQVIRDNPKPGEPSQWAKISYPPGANVWVHASYVDPEKKTVKPKRLNVRAGPGENYSIVGLIEEGDAVKEISVKGNWMEIEPTAEAYAFMAAQYLEQEGEAATLPPVVSIAPPEPEPTPATISEPPQVAPPPVEPPTITSNPSDEPPGITPEPEPDDAPAPPAEEPAPPRIVSHQGIVKSTWSIQAPTKFALVSADTGRTINYLYTTSTNLDLARYKGLNIIVTGEEGLDERWRNTPVITIQRIQVVE